jgi:hypothetical protein
MYSALRSHGVTEATSDAAGKEGLTWKYCFGTLKSRLVTVSRIGPNPDSAPIWKRNQRATAPQPTSMRA